MRAGRQGLTAGRQQGPRGGATPWTRLGSPLRWLERRWNAQKATQSEAIWCPGGRGALLLVTKARASALPKGKGEQEEEGGGEQGSLRWGQASSGGSQ